MTILAAFTVLVSAAACGSGPGPKTPTATATRAATAAPSPSSSQASSAQPSASASPKAAVSAGFKPDAMSAISESEFWVLGQDASCNSASCAVQIAHTVDGGTSFEKIPAPPLPSMASASGLARGLRFANHFDGWMFGDQLWSTHDGGTTWHRLYPGETVPQLEPGANGYVYAVLETCPSTSTPCQSQLMRARASSDTWSAIAPAGASGRPQIGVHGDSLWAMYFGSSASAWISHDDGAHFDRVTTPCDPSLGGRLDPVTDSVVWVFCATGNFGTPFVSTDGGRTFTTAGAGSQFSNGAVVAALSAQHAFTTGGGTSGLSVTDDGGRTYHDVPQVVHPDWVGFTDSRVGYATGVGDDVTSRTLWRTTDGGNNWSKVSFA
jgi:photosystem II stability/assembly factor-like uncharacterized protein